MLLRRAVLDRIAAGEIDLVFRRWKRPTVKTGGTLQTSVGVLAIGSVVEIRPGRITSADAHRAGYPSRRELLEELDRRPDGRVYRIEVHRAGPDPRIELRNRTAFEGDELPELSAALARLDDRNRRGPWTIDTLRLLAEHPRVRAQDLADEIGRDKASFKADVRKLKALGLTISHSPGYELSPRGLALLGELDPGSTH